MYIMYLTMHQKSNDVIWYIRSHITCQSKNAIYIQKCTSCNYCTTYIGKNVDLHSRMNNHIPFCRLGGFHEQIWQPGILLYSESETRIFFSDTNVYKTSGRTESTISWNFKVLPNRGYDTLNK